MARTWLCRCGHRNERIHQRCRNPAGCTGKRPKKRLPKHARVSLGEMTKKDYAPINRDVHGVDELTCAICGREEEQGKWLQRDHSHEGDGYPRGLLCATCNEKLGHAEKFGTRGEAAEHWLMLAHAYLRRARLENSTNED